MCCAGYLRRNWCSVVRLVLAIIGITVPVIMFLKPCNFIEIYTYVTYKAPLDLYLLLDGSASMQNDWATCLSAAANISGVFANSYETATEENNNSTNSTNTTFVVGDVRIGAGQFGSNAYTILNFTNDTDYAIETILDSEWMKGTTNYEEGLQLFMDMWTKQRNPDPWSYTILVMISDGVPRNYTGSDEYEMTYDLMADQFRSSLYNISIMGIMVTNEEIAEATAALQTVSSCDGLEGSDLTNCTWFASFNNFATFQSHATGIAESLAGSLVPYSFENVETKCEKGPWLGFLVLLLPLIYVMILPYLVPLKRRVRLVRMKEEQPLSLVNASAAVGADVVIQHIAEEPEERLSVVEPLPPRGKTVEPYPEAAKRRGKYKWSIKKPEHQRLDGVQWKKNRAPVAKDPDDEVNIRLEEAQPPIEIIDLGNGYVEEVYIEDRTLEQWAEDTAVSCWKEFLDTVCCCCLRQKHLEE